MPKVSIIMPALNSIKYIKECMDSVISQTLEDIEIIPVDAGSTDGTWKIFQRYAENDNRIKPIHSAKKSMGYQYNIGIAAATGKYIGFVETDDYIKADMFEKLYEVAEKADVDWVKADFNLFVDLNNGERIAIKNNRFTGAETELYGRVINPEKFPELLLGDYYMWPGIYKREFIQKNVIKLNETPGASFQDTGFVQQSLLFAKRVMYVEAAYYQYRRDNEGSSDYKSDGLNYIFDEFKFIINIMEKRDCRIFEKYIYTHFFSFFEGNYRKLPITDDVSLKTKDSIKEYIKILKKADQNNKIFRSLCDWPSAAMFEDLETYSKNIRIELKHQEDILVRFLQVVNQYSQVVIFGSGEAGQKICCFCKLYGLSERIVCFADNSQMRWGNMFTGLNVLAPEKCIQHYPDALFIVANANIEHQRSIKRQLRCLGISDENICLAPILNLIDATNINLICKIQKNLKVGEIL